MLGEPLKKEEPARKGKEQDKIKVSRRSKMSAQGPRGEEGGITRATTGRERGDEGTKAGQRQRKLLV